MLFFVTIFLANLSSVQASVLPDLPSVVEISVQEESLAKLNKQIQINETILLKLNVSLTIVAPEKITFTRLGFPFIMPFDGGIGRYIYFSSTVILYPIPVKLSITGYEGWAKIQLFINTIYVDPGPEKITAEAALIISPRIISENVPKTFTIRAETLISDGLKVIPSSHELSLQFKSDFNDHLQIDSSLPLKKLTPFESKTYYVNIKNHGNKHAEIRASLLNFSDSWDAIITPTTLVISPHQTNTIGITISGPRSMGWHNEVENFTLELISTPYPNSINSQQDSSYYHFSVTAVCEGFSTPGFEGSLFFIILPLSLIILHRRKQR